MLLLNNKNKSRVLYNAAFFSMKIYYGFRNESSTSSWQV